MNLWRQRQLRLETKLTQRGLEHPQREMSLEMLMPLAPHGRPSLVGGMAGIGENKNRVCINTRLFFCLPAALKEIAGSIGLIFMKSKLSIKKWLPGLRPERGLQSVARIYRGLKDAAAPVATPLAPTRRLIPLEHQAEVCFTPRINFRLSELESWHDFSLVERYPGTNRS